MHKVFAIQLDCIVGHNIILRHRMDFVFSGLKLILCHIQVSMLKSKSVLLNQFDWSLPSVRSSIIVLLPLLTTTSSVKTTNTNAFVMCLLFPTNLFCKKQLMTDRNQQQKSKQTCLSPHADDLNMNVVTTLCRYAIRTIIILHLRNHDNLFSSVKGHRF